MPLQQQAAGLNRTTGVEIPAAVALQARDGC